MCLFSFFLIFVVLVFRVCCSLFVLLFFVVCYVLLFVGCWLLYVVVCWLMVVGWWLFALGSVLFNGCGLQCVVRSVVFVVCCMLFVVCCMLFLVFVVGCLLLVDV